MPPEHDTMDFPRGLEDGGSIDAFRSRDDDEKVALFIKGVDLDGNETVQYHRISRHDVEMIIGRLVSALVEF